MRGLLLFDIDGTLLRTGDLIHQQALLDAIQTVFQLDASLEGVPLGGMLDSQIVRLALAKHHVPVDDVRSGLPLIMQHMGTRYHELLDGEDRRSWVLPGVVELIARSAATFTLSVLTGNASGVARAKLEAAGIDQYFPFGAYGDSADHRHELVAVAVGKVREVYGLEPRPRDIVIIGDTPRDIEAARESGAMVLAVATGRYPVDVLSEHWPDLLFEDLSEVERVYQALENATAPEARSPGSN